MTNPIATETSKVFPYLHQQAPHGKPHERI